MPDDSAGDVLQGGQPGAPVHRLGAAGDGRFLFVVVVVVVFGVLLVCLLVLFVVVVVVVVVVFVVCAFWDVSRRTLVVGAGGSSKPEKVERFAGILVVKNDGWMQTGLFKGAVRSTGGSRVG